MMEKKLDRREFLKTLSAGALGAGLAFSLHPFGALGQIPWDSRTDSLFLPEAEGLDLSAMHLIGEGTKNEYPSLVIDADDRIHLAWVSEREGGEAVYLKSFYQGKWGNEIQVPSVAGMECQPEIILVDKKLYVCWTAKRNRQWDIYLRTIENGRLGDELLISDHHGISWRPALSSDQQGNVWIAWERKEGQNFNVVARKLSAAGLSPIYPVPEITGVDNYRPTIAVDKKNNVWFAWDRYEGNYNYNIYLRPFSNGQFGKEIKVTFHPAMDMAPALAVDRGDRLWIGWHSNRKGTDEWDLPRWFYLRCYKDGQFFEPVSPPLDMDLSKKDTIQGFEFVSLICTGDGKICVTGRPSHNFCLQYYHGDKWSRLFRFPKDGWGGRGQYLKAAFDNNGDLWVVRRDLSANVLQKLSGLKKEAKEPVLKKVIPAALSVAIVKNISQKYNFPSLDKYNYYFGDIHYHSWMSDGMGDPDEFYTRSRDIYRDDFAVLTDHDYFVGNGILPSEWELLKEITDHYNEEHKFLTLFAEEWTTARTPRGFGHKNVYTINRNMPLFDHTDPGAKTSKELFEKIKKYQAIAVPHHIGWTGVDWENADPEVMPVVEICSVHGVFEYMGNKPIPHRGGIAGCFIQDGLAKGLKFGLVGGSDCHGLIWHHRVCWKREASRAGLTCILAPELTRQALMEALKMRRCYATTGVKVGIDFQINGHIMGQEFATSDKPQIQVDVISPEHELKWLTIVKNNKDIYTYGGEGHRSRFTFTDEDISPGLSYYYLRVIFEDGNMAWSSPIWINYKA